MVLRYKDIHNKTDLIIFFLFIFLFFFYFYLLLYIFMNIFILDCQLGHSSNRQNIKIINVQKLLSDYDVIYTLNGDDFN